MLFIPPVLCNLIVPIKSITVLLDPLGLKTFNAVLMNLPLQVNKI